MMATDLHHSHDLEHWITVPLPSGTIRQICHRTALSGRKYIQKQVLVKTNENKSLEWHDLVHPVKHNRTTVHVLINALERQTFHFEMTNTVSLSTAIAYLNTIHDNCLTA